MDGRALRFTTVKQARAELRALAPRKTARPSIRAEPGRAAGPRPRRLPTSVVASVQKFRYDTGEAITQPKQITGTGPSVPPAEVTGENQGAPHRGIIRLLNLRGKLSQRHAPSSASYCIRTRSTASVQVFSRRASLRSIPSMRRTPRALLDRSFACSATSCSGRCSAERSRQARLVVESLECVGGKDCFD